MLHFVSFAQKEPVTYLISRMLLTKVYMEFNLSNIQIIESQLCLLVSKLFSSNLSYILQK